MVMTESGTEERFLNLVIQPLKDKRSGMFTA